MNLGAAIGTIAIGIKLQLVKPYPVNCGFAKSTLRLPRQPIRQWPTNGGGAATVPNAPLAQKKLEKTRIRSCTSEL
jgi:hypothetical protein